MCPHARRRGQSGLQTSFLATTWPLEPVSKRKSAVGAWNSKGGRYSGARLNRRRSRANLIWEMLGRRRPSPLTSGKIAIISFPQRRGGITLPQAIIANPMCFRELALEDAIRNVLSIGFDLVEIWRQNALPFKTPALRHQLRDFVAEMGSSICGLNSCDAAFFQALSGPETVAEALAGFKGDIDIGIFLKFN